MSASDMTYADATRERRSGRPLRELAWPAAAVLSGLLVAYLIAKGLWFVVPPILLLVPAFVVVHRYPMAAVSLWIVAAPSQPFRRIASAALPVKAANSTFPSTPSARWRARVVFPVPA